MSGQPQGGQAGGWERKLDPRGFAYWVNHTTRKISYSTPGSVQVPNAQPQQQQQQQQQQQNGQPHPYAGSYTGSEDQSTPGVTQV